MTWPHLKAVILLPFIVVVVVPDLPGWPLWAVIILLLVFPRANRCRQAWLILLPLGLVLLVWRMPLMLFGVPDDFTAKTGVLVVSVAMTWTMVWLLGHWLTSRHRSVTFFLMLGLMLAIPLVSYYCHFKDTDWYPPITCSLGVLILLLVTTFNSHFCRKRCTLLRFLGWLVLWTGLAAFLVTLAFAVVFIFTMRVMNWVECLVAISAAGTLELGGTVYLLNLPFLVLAFKSPFYRKRFESIFGIAPISRSDVESQTPSA